MADIQHVAPELFLLLAAATLLVVSGYWKQQQQLTAISAITALVMSTILAATAPGGTVFAGSFINDTMSTVLKVAMLLSAAIALLYSEPNLKTHNRNRREHYVLGLFAMLGGCLMVSAQNMLLLYTGLELMSLSMIAMVAVHQGQSLRLEAAMKYFTLSAMASGVLLYGMSMLYGASGSLQFAEIANATNQDNGFIVLGLVFTMAGIAFKLGAVPFHAWVPDVYEGATAPVTLFIGSAPKIAAFAMAARILTEALPQLQDTWIPMLAILAALSVILGNLAAIMQQNIRRMLGYSTIAHMGFMLLGMLTATEQGFAASMHYTIIYIIMSTGALGLITILGSKGEDITTIDQTRGLANKHPIAALAMLIILFSMAGIPPFAGFWAKWLVLAEALQAGYIKLAILAVSCSVAGAFYYLRIIRYMYFEQTEEQTEEEQEQKEQKQLPKLAMTIVAINATALLALGIIPDTILTWCMASFSF